MAGFEMITRTVLLALMGISFFAIILLCYILWLVFRDGAKKVPSREHIEEIDNTRRFAVTLVYLSLFSMAWLWAAGHFLVGNTVSGAGSYAVGLFLLGGILIAGYLYFRMLPNGVEDDRLRYTMMVWIGVTIMIAMSLLWLAWARPYLRFDGNLIDFGKDTLGGFANGAAQLMGIMVAAIIVVTTNSINSKRQRDATHQQIYQSLELASIELFRFENRPDSRNLIKTVWVDEQTDLDDVEKYRVQEYVCQFLNLFEMAVRFRRDDVMPHDVFGSWLIWIWELCGRPVFQSLWHAGLRWNYIELLREVVNVGIELQKLPQPDEQKREMFFKEVSRKFLDCPYCENWFVNAKTG